MVRTRFAPSPTGYMHIGNLRTALYGYLFARKQGGSFILRIEDTDQERFVEGSLDVIYKTLKETGLEYDEGPDKDGGFGPYTQSQRKALYKQYAEQLVQKGAAYYCFCTDEQLAEARINAEAQGKTYKYEKKCLSLSEAEITKRIVAGEPYVIRQNTPLEGSVSFLDAIFGEISVDCAELDDMVLLKSDGLPTYNFANVVDDHLMNITHVMRGSEYLSSTPKYNLLYNAFGWEPPIYVHLPLIMKDAHNKLSKRNGDASYQDLIAKGYLMDAVINYIALLGWSSGTNQEIFNREELIDIFSLEGISKSPAIFDPLKLLWMNGEYIKKMPLEQFNALCMPWYEQSVVAGKYDYLKLSKILQQRLEIFSQISDKIAFLPEVGEFELSLYTNKKFKLELEGALESLQMALPALEAIELWNEENIHNTLINLATEKGKKNGQLLWPVRIALTGQESTPGGAIELSDILGRTETLKRVRAGIERLQGCRDWNPSLQ